MWCHRVVPMGHLHQSGHRQEGQYSCQVVHHHLQQMLGFYFEVKEQIYLGFLKHVYLTHKESSSTAIIALLICEVTAPKR